MDVNTFQENWSTICRKFPLVCLLDLTNVSNEDDVSKIVSSHCLHFDNVIVMADRELQEGLKQFCKNERIINLTYLKSSDIPGESFDVKVRNATRGQFLLITSKVKNVTGNIRWLVYDRAKEMKSPLTDTIKIDENGDYCLENESYRIVLRMS
jgi:hypothetical protein